MRLVKILVITTLLCGAGKKPAESEAFPSSWTQPTEPFHIAGPIYYVGTVGIAVYLIKTDAGHILLSGTPSEGAGAVSDAIKKLGLKPADIKLILSSHAHFDHAGSLAAHKKAFGADLVAMEQDVDLLKSGGQLDFLFSNRPAFRFEGVATDRKIKDGDRVTLGNVTLTANLTPGHTKGCTTWQMEVHEGGKAYNVVFVDGMTINPGTRFVKDPSYPTILSDYQKTFRTLASIKPDIFLSYHTEFFDLETKKKRAASEGITAWIDRAGFEELRKTRETKFKNIVADERDQAQR